MLQYVANDASGTLTVPAAELARLPAGSALIILERRLETPVIAGGKTYLGVGSVIQQGFANLVPPCNQQEAEANDTVPAATAITGSLATPYNACGQYTAKGDLDHFKFTAAAGQVLSARTYAAEIGSALDSVLELIAPDGRVFSNDNANPSTNDSSLFRTLDMAGTWTLKVTHSQANRVGGPGYFYNLLLNLRSVPGAAFAFPGTLEGATPLPACSDIPDSPATFVDGPAASCTVTLSGAAATTSDLNILVDIAHTYASDVKLELTHPDGTKVLLTNHTGRIRGIFDLDTRVDDRALTMNAFDGKNPNGVWTLRATDWYSFDTGKIRSAILFVAP
jgi:hypothetical protein